MSQITLTDVERLILANQYEILGLLQKDESHRRLADMLRDGHEWLYSEYLDHLAPVLPKEQAEYVIKILRIFSDMRDSYAQLTDKSGIEPHQVEFPGFDGNSELELLSFSRALAQSGRFRESLGDHGKNSYMPTTGMYGRIIERWKQLGKPMYPYDKRALLEILAARIHPDSRK